MPGHRPADGRRGPRRHLAAWTATQRRPPRWCRFDASGLGQRQRQPAPARRYHYGLQRVSHTSAPISIRNWEVSACPPVGWQGTTASRLTSRRRDSWAAAMRSHTPALLVCRRAFVRRLVHENAPPLPRPLAAEEDVDAAGVHESDVSEVRHDPPGGVASGLQGLAEPPGDVVVDLAPYGHDADAVPLGVLDGERFVAGPLSECRSRSPRLRRDVLAGAGTQDSAPRVRADALTRTAASGTPTHDGGQSGIPASHESG